MQISIEHPAIQTIERAGYAAPVQCPRCPVCGEEADTIYCGRYGEVFGCGSCVSVRDAWEAGLDE